MTDRVSPDRWAEAQSWERDVWGDNDLRLRGGQGLKTRILRALGLRRPPIGDDWNSWWRDKFDGYRALPAHVENAIELGSGPFTNMRLVLEHTSVDHLYCSDPLARHYLTLQTSWLRRAVVTGRAMLDDHPAEACPYATEYFDLVVMVNVLDHVRDADKCVREALRVCRPGGLLVIGQDLTDEHDAAKFPDVGHPIRLDHIWLDQRLLASCRPVLHRVLPREDGRNPSAHYGTYLLIGEKQDAAER